MKTFLVGPIAHESSQNLIESSSAQAESGGIVLATGAGPRAPSGGVTRQGVVLTDLECVLLCFISTDVSHLIVRNPPPPR